MYILLYCVPMSFVLGSDNKTTYDGQVSELGHCEWLCRFGLLDSVQYNVIVKDGTHLNR